MSINYFKPKPFESWRKSSIYVWLGVRLFKRYVPTTGDAVRKWRDMTQLTYRRASLVNDLWALEQQTRRDEFRHWLGLLIFAAIALGVRFEYRWFDYVFVCLLFLLLNVYPILLQRHNRIRILRLLHLKGLPSPYDKPKSEK